MIEYIDDKTRRAFENVKKDIMELREEVELIKRVLTKRQLKKINEIKLNNNIVEVDETLYIKNE